MCMHTETYVLDEKKGGEEKTHTHTSNIFIRFMLTGVQEAATNSHIAT